MTGQAARAEKKVNINPGNLPTTAGQVARTCEPHLGGGRFPDVDVWVFNLPGSAQATGVFESVTATFATPGGGSVTVSIPSNGGAIVNDMGTSKAWVRLPDRWTLTAGSAVITGTGESFVLSHACAASDATPTPTGTTPTPRPTGTTPTGPPTETALPLTGAARGRSPITAMLSVGGVAIVLGLVMMTIVKRARDTPH